MQLHPSPRRTAPAGLLIAVFLAAPSRGPLLGQEVTVDDYSRAAQLLGWNAQTLILGGPVQPNWMPDGNRFWYRTRVQEGHEFVLVDPDRTAKAPLFDRHRLASALSLAADTSFVGTKLPFQEFEFAGGRTASPSKPTRNGSSATSEPMRARWGTPFPIPGVSSLPRTPPGKSS